MKSEMKLELKSGLKSGLKLELKLDSIFGGKGLKNGIVIGLSGGPDSVCMLHAFSKIIPIEQLVAVHVNHMLRNEESDADQAYCRKLCKQMGIEMFEFKVDIGHLATTRRIGLEECGRQERYKLFEKVREEKGFDFIAVAHNRNDQAETILMNIARGTGIDGLKGMEIRRDKIIRPLLEIGREQIEEYCAQNELNPRTDSSNLLQDYTRNKVRLEIIPLLNKAFDKDVSQQLVSLGKIAREESEFLDNIAKENYDRICLERNNDNIRLRCVELHSLDRVIALRVIRIAVSYVARGMKDFAFSHFEAIYRLASSKVSGKVIDLPAGIEAYYAYEELSIRTKGSKKKILKKEESILEVPGITFFDKYKIVSKMVEFASSEMFSNGKNVIIVDVDKINEKLIVRNRRNGDIIYPFHSNGTKKLKEYLIDKKTPRNERDILVLLACGNEIVWIFGDVASKKYLATSVTERFLEIEIQ